MSSKLIGYTRVSTRVQHADREIQDIHAARLQLDDLYIDHGQARALHPENDRNGLKLT